MRKHVAYNIVTGEIYIANHANQLKRLVAYITWAYLEYFGEYSKWIFAHGNDWREKLRTKVQHYTARSH